MGDLDISQSIESGVESLLWHILSMQQTVAAEHSPGIKFSVEEDSSRWEHGEIFVGVQ